MSEIVVVSSKFLPEYSGPGERIVRLYDWLNYKHGKMRPNIYCDSQDYLSKKCYSERDYNVFRTGWAFYEVLFRYTPILKKVLLEIEAFFLLRLAIKRARVIHVLGSSPVTHIALFWAKYYERRVVLELVNRNSVVFQRVFGFYKIKLRPDLITYVVISKELELRCTRAGVSSNIWIRPNPVDISRFHTGRVSNVFEKENGRINLLCVASFIPRKNQLKLVQVMPDLPDCFSLVLAGPLTNKKESLPYFKRISAEVSRLGLDSRISLIPGFVDTAELLNECDIYVMPAVNEGLGTPMLEALCAERPVIANIQEPVFRDWVKQGVAGYTVPMTSQGLLEGLTKCKDLRKNEFDSYCTLVRDKVNSESIHYKYFDLLFK